MWGFPKFFKAENFFSAFLFGRSTIYLSDYHAPRFISNASEFHVTLWNLNYKDNVIGEITPDGTPLILEFVKDNGEVVVKESVKDASLFAKEFVKASRPIYKSIFQNPQISAAQMSENMGVSPRLVQKYRTAALPKTVAKVRRFADTTK